MKNEKRTIYVDKTGRSRLVINKKDGSSTSISYPRIIMEKVLGRKLRDDEVVHHKDGNPMNNDPSNLITKTRSEHSRDHQQKYYDKLAICEVCGKEFIWTAKRQRCYYMDLRLNRGPRYITCSKRCSGRISRCVQLGREIGDRYKGVACTIYNNTYYNYYNPYFRI